MFSGAKILRPFITYPFEFTLITTKKANKQYVGKSLCPNQMFWVKLMMFFQPKRYIKQRK